VTVKEIETRPFLDRSEIDRYRVILYGLSLVASCLKDERETEIEKRLAALEAILNSEVTQWPVSKVG
jgi:hypothetical protein